MGTKAKHIAAPWQRSGSLIVKDLSYDKSVTVALYEIATTKIGHWKGDQAEANAAFIVKCVNTHGQLVEALKEACEFIKLNHPARATQDWEALIAKAEAPL